MITFEAYRERLRRCREAAERSPDAGSFTTETAVIVAILVAIAVAVGAVLMSKVMNKVDSLDLK
ncbi:hypothetical protein ACFY05_06545 [Microtetraspora fusca]|uniref:Uncharacterized protein n=1 Tax=Microtetraspora fusca TaxID=1997 RepID=A0ABW6UZZ3_MICFU